jgi:hypothetical protein
MVAQNIVAMPYAAPRPGEADAMDSDAVCESLQKDGRLLEILWACAAALAIPRNAFGPRYCLSPRSTGEYEVYKQGVLRINGPRKAEKRVEW